MRVKIVEAWARGLPIVSTTIGAEGINYIDGENILIADTPQTFAAALARLLTDSTLANRLRTNGLETVKTLYNWRIAYKSWDALYRPLTPA
jgi:polysaccharide biosynthesis protein PslH